MKRYLMTGLGTSLILVTSVAFGVMLWPAETMGAPEAAQSVQSSGRDLVGLWYALVPTPFEPLTAFTIFHRDGTMSAVRSVDAGGVPPPPIGGPQTHSAMLGIWRHVRASRFEAMVFLIDYDLFTGNAVGMTRVRSIINLDRGGDSASAEFFAAFWVCDTVLPCPPDPTKVAPTVPEGPVGGPYTYTRVSLP